jgi:hypothetical protein
VRWTESSLVGAQERTQVMLSQRISVVGGIGSGLPQL